MNLAYVNVPMLNPNELYPSVLKRKGEKKKTTNVNKEEQKNEKKRFMLFVDVLMKRPPLICHLPLLLWSCMSILFLVL